MTRDEALTTLRSHQRELSAEGVKALYLFGSTARGDSTDDSDVDLLYEFDREKRFSLFDQIALGYRLQSLLGRRVDLVERGGLRPFIRTKVEPDLVRVF